MVKRDLRVGIFVDSVNIGICAMNAFNRKIDYKKLLNYALEDNYLFRAMVYAVRFGEKMDGWVRALEGMGYEVFIKDLTTYADGHKKADWDTGIAVDVFRMLDQFDVLVLVSGDGDFLPLVQLARSRGKIVHVIGVENSTNRRLKSREEGGADKFKAITQDILMPAEQKKHIVGEDIVEDEGPQISEEDRAKLDAEIDEYENGKT